MNQTQVLSKPPTHNEPPSDASGRFALTQWTVILKARDEEAPGAAEALDQFARTYWKPIFGSIRREGFGRQDAEDLTQEFYGHLSQKRLLERIHEPQGKFRNFLLTCLKHFLSDQRDRRAALKRGGGVAFQPLDTLDGEDVGGEAAGGTLTPEQRFDRQWAETILDQSLARLRQEFVETGKLDLFEQLKDIQFGEHTTAGYVELAPRLGMSQSALKSAVHRMKRRLHALLREEVGRTVSRTAEIDEEIRYLLLALGPCWEAR